MPIVQAVHDLRKLTGAGMMDCYHALENCDEDSDQAIDWLRQQGIIKARDVASRPVGEGRIAIVSEYADGSIVSEDGSAGVHVMHEGSAIDLILHTHYKHLFN